MNLAYALSDLYFLWPILLQSSVPSSGGGGGGGETTIQPSTGRYTRVRGGEWGALAAAIEPGRCFRVLPTEITAAMVRLQTYMCCWEWM